MTRLAILLSLALAGCSEDAMIGPDASITDGSPRDAATIDDAATLDAHTRDASGPSAIAPSDTIPGEIPAIDGDVTITAGDTVRVDVDPDEHVTFFLTFDDGDAPVVLEVLRWDGADPVPLGLTDAGPRLRTLAVFDPSGPRTFWARVRTEDGSALDATLAITRVPFEDAAICTDDCAHLLQLPLPNDPEVDGYRFTSSTILRYQYGRRDLLMFIRHAGQQMIAHGLAPFVPEDLSQWNGETPGNDVGAPRHASHQRGKDVDISLYGLDGRSEWRSYCTVERTAEGRECVPGTVASYDADANAIFFGDFFATGRVTMCFLDAELIAPTIPAAEDAAIDGSIPASVVPLYSDGRHLQHWPNHDNHIHVRVSEEVTGATFTWSLSDDEPSAPIEPP